MQGMSSFLLFAGALHVDLSELRAYRWQVGALAVIGTLMSTVVVGAVLFWTLPWVGLPMLLLYCVLFGALISPTDPIAVMGILKSAGAPKNLELVIAGESLFNGGIGVVIFSLLLGMLASGDAPTLRQVGELLLQEAGGGLLFGAALGYVTFRLLRAGSTADHAGRRDGRLCTALRAARVRSVGDGGGRPDDRPPRPGAGDVGQPRDITWTCSGNCSTRS